MQSVREDTRVKIIRAAERIIATRGPDGAAMQAIVAESGQKNASAVHYHFGSKTALIAAVLARRMTDINKTRIEMLSRIELSPSTSIVDMLKLIVLPVAEQFYDERGCYHCRLVMRMLRHDDAARDYIDFDILAPYRQVMDMLTRAVSRHIPEMFIENRIVMLNQHLIAGLAEIEDQHDTTRPWETRARVLDLILCATSAIMTPIGGEVASAMENARTRSVSKGSSHGP